MELQELLNAKGLLSLLMASLDRQPKWLSNNSTLSWFG